MVVADSLLSMSAWPYTEENIETAKHTNKLRDAGYLTLNIDLIQMGVGGNDSWSDVAAPPGKIPDTFKEVQLFILSRTDESSTGYERCAWESEVLRVSGFWFSARLPVDKHILKQTYFKEVELLIKAS